MYWLSRRIKDSAHFLTSSFAVSYKPLSTVKTIFLGKEGSNLVFAPQLKTHRFCHHKKPFVMSEQNLEAKLIALHALILERETLFSSSILKHKEFGKVKAIYMKTKLLKISYAILLKKFSQEKENRQPAHKNKPVSFLE